MGFFKRKKSEPTLQPKAAEDKPAAVEQTPAPVNVIAEQDEFFGDEELRAACAALEIGSWEPADSLLDERGEDGWTDSKLGGAVTMESATAWSEAEPSGRSFAMLGATRVTAAWDARGNGLGNTVGLGSAMSFYKILGQAEEALTKAIEHDDTIAMPWVQMLAVSKGLGKPVEERRELFDEAHKRVPFHRGAVAAAIQALSEKWGGDEDEYLDFARWIEREAPEGHPSRLALPLAIHECSVVAGLKANRDGDKFFPAYIRYCSQDHLVDELDQSLVRLLDATPEVAPAQLVEALNAHLNMTDPLGREGIDTRLRLLKAIDNRSTSYPWRDRDEFLDRQQRTIWFARAIMQYPEAGNADLAALYMVKHNISVPAA